MNAGSYSVAQHFNLVSHLGTKMKMHILLVAVLIAIVHGQFPRDFTLNTARGTILGIKNKLNGTVYHKFLGKIYNLCTLKEFE